MLSEINVLILEDEYQKTEQIVALLLGEGVSQQSIRQVVTANDARRELRANQYDLLILDIHVPAMIGAPVQADGGIALLKLLKMDSQVKMPSQVIGITSKDGAFEEAEKELKALSWTLCKFDSGSEAWKQELREKVAHTLRCKKLGSKKSYDIALITALRETEFEAVLALPCSWRELSLEDDSTVYFEGEIKTQSGVLSIIAAAALRMGMPSAAALASKMTIQFRPKILAMVGICAGKSSETKLGHVIVADPVWDWGSGKIKERDGELEFAISPHQVALHSTIRSKIRNVKDSPEILREIRAGWDGDLPEGALKIHIGPMASGASVVANSSKMDEIGEQHRDMIGLEMEAYAVMAAVEYALDPAPKAIVIKSVCDFGDSNKHARWQKYAAYTSAQCFYILFRDYLEV